MTLDELKSLLARFRVRPDKRLGQNFLLSEQALKQIVEAADLTPQDVVLEIGPGLGALTAKLAAVGAEIFAVEKDRKLAAALRRLFRNKKNVHIISGDALFFNPADYGLEASNYKVVANIPYYLTGKLLQNFLSSSPSPRQIGLDASQGGRVSSPLPRRQEGTKGGGIPHPTFPPLGGEELKEGGGEKSARPSLMVLLLQKEVAERIVARPGEMSLLSVSVQFYSEPGIVAFISKHDFYPVPEVDSAIVRLKVFPEPRFVVEEKKFFQLVKIGFSNRRKQLHNNLHASPPPFLPHWWGGSGGGGKIYRSFDYKKILMELGLNPLVRAQDLSLEDWVKLYERIVKK